LVLVRQSHCCGLAQAWEDAAAAAGTELTPQQKWQVGVDMVAALGDPASAEE